MSIKIDAREEAGCHREEDVGVDVLGDEGIQDTKSSYGEGGGRVGKSVREETAVVRTCEEKR